MAIHYYNKLSDCFLSTNLKVWFSSLEKQKGLSRVKSEDLVRSNKKHYLLVRDPYLRIESFFKDKFRQSPSKRKSGEIYQWQDCQKIFFPYLNIREDFPIEVVRDKLISTEFESFIELLPRVWNLNLHLFPQHTAHFFVINGNQMKINFESYLKVESHKTIEFLENVMGLDMKIPYNSSSSLNTQLTWTNKSIQIINSIYQIDLITFGYEYRTVI